MKLSDPARLGERLRVARTAAGLTPEQAAESVGMDRTTLVAFEKGEREARPEELIALAKRYEVSVHSLLRPTAVKVKLVEQLRKKGRTPESDRDVIAALGILRLLAAEASELELYSEGQLADMLALDRVELRCAIDAFLSLESIGAQLEVTPDGRRDRPRR